MFPFHPLDDYCGLGQNIQPGHCHPGPVSQCLGPCDGGRVPERWGSDCNVSILTSNFQADPERNPEAKSEKVGQELLEEE